MRFDRLIVTMAVLACFAASQQPNVGGVASMVVDGNNGPPWPININGRTNTNVFFVMSGFTNANFSIVRSANGSVQPGAATFFGDLYDLPLSPPYVVCIDGLANPTFSTDGTGQFAFQVTVPPPGTPPAGIPIGFTQAYQAAMVDYFSPHGWSLTAATRATVTQGPTVVNMSTGIFTYGDSGQATVNLGSMGITLPFYGVNHTTVHISGDGYMTFGGGQVPDFTPSDIEMNGGPPRIAAMWTDLDQTGPAVVRYTIDPTPPGGTPPFIFVEFINVYDALGPFPHNFTWKIDTQGVVQIVYQTTNNTCIYDIVSGIGPGQNLGSPQAQKNFVGTQPPGSMVGNGILTSPPFSKLGNVNENFFEWFGIITQHLYYANAYDNPFDLVAVTLNFLPSGTGSLPGATNRYTCY